MNPLMQNLAMSLGLEPDLVSDLCDFECMHPEHLGGSWFEKQDSQKKALVEKVQHNVFNKDDDSEDGDGIAIAGRYDCARIGSLQIFEHNREDFNGFYMSASWAAGQIEGIAYVLNEDNQQKGEYPESGEKIVCVVVF